MRETPSLVERGRSSSSELYAEPAKPKRNKQRLDDLKLPELHDARFDPKSELFSASSVSSQCGGSVKVVNPSAARTIAQDALAALYDGACRRAA